MKKNIKTKYKAYTCYSKRDRNGEGDWLFCFNGYLYITIESLTTWVKTKLRSKQEAFHIAQTEYGWIIHLSGCYENSSVVRFIYPMSYKFAINEEAY